MPRCCEAATPPNALTPPRWASSPRCLKPTVSNPALVQSVDQYGRAGATAMMEARGHIDVLVPRGGAGLIQAVVRNSKVPVIETGAGNVHIYIDKSGDLAKAIPIIIERQNPARGRVQRRRKAIGS